MNSKHLACWGESKDSDEPNVSLKNFLNLNLAWELCLDFVIMDGFQRWKNISLRTRHLSEEIFPPGTQKPTRPRIVRMDTEQSEKPEFDRSKVKC